MFDGILAFVILILPSFLLLSGSGFNGKLLGSKDSGPPRVPSAGLHLNGLRREVPANGSQGPRPGGARGWRDNLVNAVCVSESMSDSLSSRMEF